MLHPTQILIVKRKQAEQEIKELSQAEIENLQKILQRDYERVDTTEWKEITASIIDKFGFERRL